MLSTKGETRPDSFHNNKQAKAMMGEKTPSGGLWKAKVGDCWEGKRNLCSQPSSVQLDWNLLSSTKTSLRKNGMIFFFHMYVPNICLSCPIQKMILFGVLRRAKFLQRIGLKKVQNGSYGAEWQAAVSLRYIFYPRTDFDCRLLHQQRIRERSEACPSQ